MKAVVSGKKGELYLSQQGLSSVRVRTDQGEVILNGPHDLILSLATGSHLTITAEAFTPKPTTLALDLGAEDDTAEVKDPDA